MNDARETPEGSDRSERETPEGDSPGLLKRLRRHAKDAVVAGTSTHGGVAGGIGGRKSRKKN